MRVFYICQRVPYPPDRGDKITTFNEIRHLSKNHEVHVFCLGDGEQDLANTVKLKEYNVASVTAVPFTGIGTKFRALLALLFGGALSVAAFNKKKLHDAIKLRFAESKPDVMIVYSCNVAQYAAHFAEVPRIMQFADLDSLKFGQYAERSGFILRWVYKLEQQRLLAYERHIADTFTHSLVCTDVERRDFERLIPGRPVTLVANGVDLEFFHPLGLEKKPGSIVFTGVMDYLPNIDAVQWFCSEIFPLVKQQVPDASFVICGSRPVPAVLQLTQIPGVTVTGRVPDTRPYMDEAQVFVAPLRMARGIQNKVLEALAMGLPCVSSTAAWSGTVIPSGDGIVAADEPSEFANRVIRLLADPDYREQMASKARQSAETYYTWEAQMQRLDQVIDAVIHPHGKPNQ
jgi:sugar transferase (PEP-CTERM/EpsH1 system associated)